MCKKKFVFLLVLSFVLLGCAGSLDETENIGTPAPTSSLLAPPTAPLTKFPATVSLATVSPSPTPTPVFSFNPHQDLRIAFALMNFETERGIYYSALSENLTLEQPLITHPFAALYNSLTWSPDGEMLAFSNSWNNQIYVLNQDGTGVRNLARASYPDWSPDGSYIAFATQDGLYIIKPDGSGLKKLVTIDTPVQAIWSPDGKNIAFLADQKTNYSGAKIHIISRDGKDLTVLTEPIANFVSRISWSPDGQKLAFGSYIDHCQKISVLDIQTGEVSDLITTPGIHKDPVWSPDGNYLIFASKASDDCTPYLARSHYGAYQLFILEVNSGSISAAISPKWVIDPALWPRVIIHSGWTYRVTEPNDYLDVHEEPSLSSAKKIPLRSGNTFTVLDGPVTADECRWWKIGTSDDIIGWVVDVPGWYVLESAPVPENTPAP